MQTAPEEKSSKSLQSPGFTYNPRYGLFKKNTLCLVAILVIEYPTDLSANNDNYLRAGPRPMDWQHSAGLQGIEHTLTIVLMRVPQVTEFRCLAEKFYMTTV